jgi:uncharacterized protein (DUF2235 family)
MKRIVICCDGTWRRLDSRHPTNVAKLARAVLPTAPDGVPQLVCHLDGVGSGQGTGALARGLDRLLGGLFGLGLTAQVEAAYRFLVFNHAPGDEVFVFGFSRGAFTARSLVGLIRNAGILDRACAERIPEALALYAERGADGHPGGARAQAFRAAHAGATLVEPDERAWRQAHVPGDWAAARGVALRYLGVWDTVGALGVPESIWMSHRVNARHRFHDTRLSGLVRAARHAVAIDERRQSFRPALWDNLEALDEGRGVYRQLWFPGDHASVGGGGRVTALSDGALAWVMQGAAREGLAFDASTLAAVRAGRDCLGLLSAAGREGGGALARLLRLAPVHRAGPEHSGSVSAAARERWQRDPGYRPATLARVAAALDRRATARGPRGDGFARQASSGGAS